MIWTKFCAVNEHTEYLNNNKLAIEYVHPTCQPAHLHSLNVQTMEMGRLTRHNQTMEMGRLTRMGHSTPFLWSINRERERVRVSHGNPLKCELRIYDTSSKITAVRRARSHTPTLTQTIFGLQISWFRGLSFYELNLRLMLKMAVVIVDEIRSTKCRAPSANKKYSAQSAPLSEHHSAFTYTYYGNRE